MNNTNYNNILDLSHRDLNNNLNLYYINNIDIYYNTINIMNNRNNTNKITCPICKCDSRCEKVIQVPELEHTCPVCLDSNVNTRLKCGHLLCKECSDNLVKNDIILTPEPESNSSKEKMTCKSCKIMFDIKAEDHKIYGVEVVCQHCQTDNVEMLLPCKHYSCKKCCDI